MKRFKHELAWVLIWVLVFQMLFPFSVQPVYADDVTDAKMPEEPSAFSLSDLRIVRVQEIEPTSAATPHEPFPALTSYGPLQSEVAPPTLPPVQVLPSVRPPVLPQAAPMREPIPFALLAVSVYGPPVASLGSPVGAGEWYTIVVRNDSVSTAYNFYLTAAHPGFFIYDDGELLVHSISGTLAMATTAGAGAITWTPTDQANLAPGEVLTLTFRLRAACDAQSGQRLEASIWYNADPAQPPVERNFAGLNITTGRGNMVIKKEPAIQNLSTPDFGQPITWTITVQNTGLGKLYDAHIQDLGGINLGAPTLIPPTTTIPVLDVNETFVYTAVGTVEACNLTNDVSGYWQCGNQAGDATVANPLSSTVSILYNPEIPNVQAQVSSPVLFDYCDAVTRTVTITLDNPGGPAGLFRLDSTLESDGFLQVIPGSVSAGWAYNATTGVFSYTAGSPAGTIPGGDSGLTLTFQVRPRTDYICSAGSGQIVFTPLYQDVCGGNLFTGAPAVMDYLYAHDVGPELAVDKNGPPLVNVGEEFVYTVTVSGQDLTQPVYVTDLLPSEFEFIGPLVPSAGSAISTATGIAWQFMPTTTPFSETLVYTVRAITTTGGVCGASQIVNNGVSASAQPPCPGCPPLEGSDQFNTAIQNNEGVSSARTSAGAFEVCDVQGFVITNTYQVTGTTTITWTGAVFTEALGTGIGGGALPGAGLEYISGSLSVWIDGVDYTALLTPMTTTGQLVIGLSPLQAAGAPTQTLEMTVTYRVRIPESALNGEVEQTFYDWTQLYLPGVSDEEACAGNNSFNQALALTISRGDLSISLSPGVLDRCHANQAIITVQDNQPDRVTDHVVVTFTASSAEIASARGFAYTGGLSALGAPAMDTNLDIGGGRGMITFTFPAGADLNGNGEIHFDIDVGCTGESPWEAGVTFDSLCGISHGDNTVLPHVYRAPNLLLFATPISYTVRDKEVIWKFFIANNGNLTATNVLITNTISGLAVFGYSVNDASGISPLTTLPVTGTPAAAEIGWNIAGLAPNEQRAFTVTARVAACTPLWADIDARLGCLGETCQMASAQVDFNTPDPYLLTNNGQSADLPMCDLGQVMFTTKNASADVTLYHLDITETMRSLFPAPGEPITVVIEEPDGTPVAMTTGFMPITQVVGLDYRLIWRAVDAPAEVYTWFNALPPLYVVRIWVPVNTTCLPNTSPQSWASAAALAPCDRQLSYDEDAVTFNTLQPDMTLLKRSSTDGVNWAERAYATPGEAVYWRLDVQNRLSARSYVAQNVVLTDTWPENFEFGYATPPGYVVDLTSRTITWTLGDVAPGAAPLTFYITGTIFEDIDACAANNLNRASLRYGCDDGCTSVNVPYDTADVSTVPDLRVFIDPSPVSLCGDEIPILIRNNGSRAYSTTLTVTLPSGHYVYSYSVSSGPMPTQVYSTPLESPRFVWDEIPGRTMSGPYEFVLTLRVDNYANSGTCPNANGMPVTATLHYDNHPVCVAPGPWTTMDDVSLNVLSPDLQVSKLPRTQTRDVGETITWTLIVTNVGTDIAENVIITDVAGSNFDVLGATPGSPGGDVPVVDGNVVTWTLTSPIPVDGVWTAQVSALMLPSGDNRNVVTATAACAVGCQSALATDTSYTTLLQEFRKNPDVQTGTIGSLLVFTFTSTLPDVDGLYEDLTITDALPAGLGYVASVLTYIYNQDAGGGTLVVLNTPTISPTLYASGPVVWRLGDQPGTVQINGVITAVIQNAPAAFDGARLVNDLRMTYTDDGQPYVYTDTADVDVLEPVLHIGKSYVTPYACNALLFQDNFNRANGAIGGGWGGGGGTWNIASGIVVPGTGGNQRTYNGSTAWTDYSFSAMVSSTDTVGDIGLLFRSPSDTNYYRFLWSRNGTTGSYRLQRVVGGTATDIGAVVNTRYEINRWYHIEIRTEGSRLQVYIDGTLVLDRTDGVYTGGYIGLYANNQNAVYFDDILVTRLDNMACTVGANDLITYTLTVSNQARLTGHDLVITDVIPAGTSFVSSALVSNDPAAAVVHAPSVGATGVLTWGVNQLAATTPFNPLAHTYFTLTVVLQVDDGIPANTVLSNQAFLAYDAWPGATQPTPIVRPYSGGSHSTAVRTVDGGIAKFGVFDPPPTATLCTLITYTLVVPTQPISATLYGVRITDVVDSRLYVENVSTGGGVNPAIVQDGQRITVTFDSVAHHTQAYITVTARISDPLGAIDGDILPNVGYMTHTTASQITQTNEITTPVYEPLVSVSKVGAITDDPQQAVYTLTVVNNGNSVAYSMRVTDTLPAGLTPIDISNGGVWSPVERTIVWTIPALDVPPPPANTLVLTYSVRLDQAIYQGSQFVNAVLVHNTSLTETIPGVRPYITDTTYPLDWPLGRLGDYVWYDFDNDGVQGTHPGERPIPGVVIDLYDSITGEYITSTVTDASGWYIFEYLPLDVTYTVIISTASYLPGGPLAPYTQTLWTIGAPDTDSNASITQTFGTLPYAITTTLTTVFTEDLTLDYGFVQLVEIGNYVWFDVNNDGLQNDGPINGLGGVTITITYPDGRVFTTTTTADGYYTFTVPIDQVYTITVTADNFLPGGPLEGYTNTLIDQGGNDAIDSDGVPMSGGLTTVTPIITENDYSFDFGLIIPNSPAIVKAVTPPTATIGQVITYTIRVPEPPVSATLEDVVVSDALSPWLEILNVVAPGSTLPPEWVPYPAVLTVTYNTIPIGEQRWITVTAAVISDNGTPPWAPVAGDQITNMATLSHSNGITTSNEVTVTVVEPRLIIDKTSDPPQGSTVVAGQAVTYTVVVTNVGDSPAYRYTFEDELPVGMRGIAPVLIGVTIDGLPVDLSGYVSGYIDVSGIFYVEFESWVPLPPGSALEIVYVAYVDVDVAAGVDLINVASIGWMSWLPDTMPGPRVYPPVTDTNTVNTGYAVFDLIKEAAPSPVAAGMLLTYTLRVTNTGVARANDVLITDTVPVGTTFVDTTSPYSGPDAADVLTWTLGTLDVGETRVLTLVVRIDSGLTVGEVSNTAWITSSEDITGTDTVTTPISPLADVTVVKRDDPDPTWAGGTLVYTLVYTNNGPSDAQNALVTDTLPAEVTFVAADPTPAGGPNPLVWNLGALPAGASGQIVITTTVNSGVTEPFTNLVTIVTDTPETDTDNNDDDESTDVLVPGLELVKTVSVGQAVRNMPFTYTIRITNTGQLTIDPLTVTDTMPADFYYTPGTGSPSEPDVWAEPTLIWYDLGPLAPGESITVSFGVTATPGITGTYVNVVTATGVTPGGTVTDTDDAPVQINDPRVVVQKQVIAFDTDLVAPNYVTFTVTITNIGISVIDVLPLVDQYDPYYLSFTDATPYPEQDEDDGMVTWNDLTGPAPYGFGRNLPPGASFVITSVFRVAHNINVTTTNMATVTDAIDIYDNPSNDDNDDQDIGGEDGGIPTPITLLYLRAVAEDGVVHVRWATIAELGTVGFDLYRAGSERWEEAGLIAHVPATGPGSTYDYLDARAEPGQVYWYWLVERVPGDATPIGEPPAPGAIYGPVRVETRLDWLPYRIYLPMILNDMSDRR